MIEIITKEQIKNIWGLSKEVKIEKDELYCIISKISNKDSMRKLTKNQANKVIKQLIGIKEKDKPKKIRNQKRTDTLGNKRTKYQRGKIYELTEILGWNDNNNRINGFVKRMFKIDRIEWLDDEQCSKLIEILKKMIVDRGLGKKLE